MVYPTAYYAKIVNEGAKPHIILPRYSSFLQFYKEGRYIRTKVVMHPGFKGKHYVEETLEYVKRIAVQSLRRRVVVD